MFGYKLLAYMARSMWGDRPCKHFGGEIYRDMIKDIQDRTVKIVFERPTTIGPSAINRDQVWQCLAPHLKAPDVEALGTTGRNFEWHVTFRSSQVKCNFLAKGLVTLEGGRKGRLFSVTDSVTVVRVFWMPHWMPDDIIRAVLSDYGEVVTMVKETTQVNALRGSATLVRRAVMKLKMPAEDLPTSMNFVLGTNMHTMLVTCPGQIPRCLRCNERGHIRRDCDTPKCETCEEFGHSTDHHDAWVQGRSMAQRLRASLRRQNSTEDMEQEPLDILGSPTVSVNQEGDLESVLGTNANDSSTYPPCGQNPDEVASQAGDSEAGDSEAGASEAGASETGAHQRHPPTTIADSQPLLQQSLESPVVERSTQPLPYRPADGQIPPTQPGDQHPPMDQQPSSEGSWTVTPNQKRRSNRSKERAEAKKNKAK